MKFSEHKGHGIYVRTILLNGGERISRRSSAYPHINSVATGQARLFTFPTPDHTASVVLKPNRESIEVQAFAEYEIVAIEDSTMVVSISEA